MLLLFFCCCCCFFVLFFFVCVCGLHAPVKTGLDSFRPQTKDTAEHRHFQGHSRLATKRSLQKESEKESKTKRKKIENLQNNLTIAKHIKVQIH